jgi:hypothetical protein
MTQRCFIEGSMDASRSPLFEPVCERLRSLFDTANLSPLPNDLDRLMAAVEDAYSRGDLFGRDAKSGKA